MALLSRLDVPGCTNMFYSWEDGEVVGGRDFREICGTAFSCKDFGILNIIFCTEY